MKIKNAFCYPLFAMARLYSLKYSRKILRSHYARFQKKKENFSSHESERFEALLRDLDKAVLRKDRQSSDSAARKLEDFAHLLIPRSAFDRFREFFFAILFAVVVAFFIRQFWFELYEVPTGSMRPTIYELDRLVVSKTTFGINPPFSNKLYLYNPAYIKRAGPIVFTAAGLDMADPDMLYFGLFKGKKRLVKRTVCKPGDTLYFYGGLIYGIDKEGKPFTQLSDSNYLQQMALEKMEHIPFISLGGKAVLKKQSSNGVFTTALLKQMNLAVARLSLISEGEITGEFFTGSSWSKEDLAAMKEPHSKPVCYSDLWGMSNFAEARLLTAEQVKSFYQITLGKEQLCALELFHTPNLTYPKPQMRRWDSGFFQPTLTPFRTLIPLQKQHLENLLAAMTTSRFCVQEGLGHSYQKGRGRPQDARFDPKFPKVADGCYEFYAGCGYHLFPGGFRSSLRSTSALYDTSVENIRKLFNMGIKWNVLVDPAVPFQPFLPGRYAYFRNGDLYVMGAPLLKKDDPTLIAFVEQELKKESASSNAEPYIAFIDRGAPLLPSGELDIEKIKAFGLKVPDDAIVALGDNYASSSDSRDFGFVPVRNLRGAPSFTFWPPSRRIGPLPGPCYPWITLPNLLVWTIAFVIILCCIIFAYKRKRRSIFKD